MLPVIHLQTKKRYWLLAHGVDRTGARDGNAVTIYCPQDDLHTIYVCDSDEFDYQYVIEGKKVS